MWGICGTSVIHLPFSPWSQRHRLSQFSSYGHSVSLFSIPHQNQIQSFKPDFSVWSETYQAKTRLFTPWNRLSVAVACLHHLSRFHYSVFCAFVQSLQGNYWQDLLKAVSRWQAGKTQELVSPTMCSCWKLYSKHLAFRWHGAAIGLVELKWVMVKVLLAEEEKLQIPRTQKVNALYSREKPCIQTHADQTRGLIADGPVSCSQRGEMWGLRGWILIGCGAHLKFKAYSCEWEKEWKVNRLNSVVCRARLDVSRQSAAAQWQGDLPRQRSTHHSSMRYHTAVYLLKSAVRVWSLFIALICMR